MSVGFFYTEDLGRREGRNGVGRELRRPGPGSWLKGAGVATSSHVTLLLGPTVDSSSWPAHTHTQASQESTQYFFCHWKESHRPQLGLSLQTCHFVIITFLVSGHNVSTLSGAGTQPIQNRLCPLRVLTLPG